MASTAAIQGVSFLKLIFQINVLRKVTILTNGEAKMCLRDGSLREKFLRFLKRIFIIAG